MTGSYIGVQVTARYSKENTPGLQDPNKIGRIPDGTLGVENPLRHRRCSKQGQMDKRGNLLQRDVDS